MDEKELKSIRETVSSIILSSVKVLNIRDFQRDYYELIGTSIPFRRFGFSSIEKFLIAIPGIHVVGVGPLAGVYADVNQKVAHVDKLITHQRISDTKHRRNAARRPSGLPRLNLNFPTPLSHCQPKIPPKTSNVQTSKPSYVRLKPNESQIKTIQDRVQKISLSQPINNNSKSNQPECNLQKSPENFTFQVDKGKAHNYKIPEFNRPQSNHLEYNQPSCSKREENISSEFEKETTNDNSYSGKTKTWSFKWDFKSPLENYFESLPEEEKLKAGTASFSVSSKTSDIYFSDSEDEYEYSKVPKDVQDNLKELIDRHPKGIWCTDLLELYKKQFNQPLNYEKFKYKTLMALCDDLDKIFRCVRHGKGDLKLYDKRRPLPPDANNYKEVNESIKKSSLNEHRRGRALPDVSDLILHRKFSNIPPDVVQLCEDLPRQWLPDGVRVGSEIEIEVGEIYDPSKFWIMLQNADTNIKLNEMMDEIQNFYAIHKELEIPEEKLHIGMYCAAMFANEYHRAIIVRYMPTSPNKLWAYFFDYGTVSTTWTKGIFYLHRKFFELPQQAIRARLANIYPLYEKTQWSPESSGKFLDLVKNKTLVAEITKADEIKMVVELLVSDVSTNTTLHINDELVRLGHAIFTIQDQLPVDFPNEVEPIVKFLHLFPSFDELEAKIVPTAFETFNLLRSGIELTSIYSHYFKKKLTEDDSSIETKNMSTRDSQPDHNIEEVASLIDFKTDYDYTNVKKNDIDSLLFDTVSNHDDFNGNSKTICNSRSEIELLKSGLEMNDETFNLLLSPSEMKKTDSNSNISQTETVKNEKDSDSNVVKTEKKEDCQSIAKSNEKSKKETRGPPPGFGFDKTVNITSNKTQNVLPEINQTINIFNFGANQQMGASMLNSVGQYGLGMLNNAFNEEYLKLMQQAQQNNFMLLFQQLEQERCRRMYAFDQEMAKANVENLTKKKLVIPINFNNVVFHLMKYSGEVLCSLYEIQRLFFSNETDNISSLIQNIFTLDRHIKITPFLYKDNEELTMQLLSYGLVTREFIALGFSYYFFPFKDLARIVNSLSQTRWDYMLFERCLIYYDYNSNVWC